MTDTTKTEFACPAFHMLFEREGTAEKLPGNRPFLLDRADTVWLVEQGRVDLFLVKNIDGQPSGARYHCGTIEPGHIFIGLPPNEWGFAILAVGLGATTLRQLPLQRFREFADMPVNMDEAVILLETWVEQLIAGSVSEQLKYTDLLMAAGDEATFDTGRSMRSQDGGLVWIELPGDLSSYMDRRLLSFEEATVITPVAGKAWIWVEAMNAVSVRAYSTRTMVVEKDVWHCLHAYYTTFFACAGQRMNQFQAEEQERLRRLSASNEASFENALTGLRSVLTAEHTSTTADYVGDALFQACSRVAEELGIGMTPPPKPGQDDAAPDLHQIAKASGFRTRRVSLTGRWWKDDTGPLLAFIEEDDRPVAVVPCSPRRLRLHDPTTGSTREVNARTAAALRPEAYQFFRPLPNRILASLELLKFGLRGSGRDIAVVLLMGGLAALLGLLVPLCTGMLFDTVIPDNARGLLLQVALGLGAVAFGSFAFRISQSIGILRAAVKSERRVETAVWDRLLKLPVEFFRGRTAGDLAMRACGILQISALVKGPVITAALSAVFMSFNLLVMFYYDWRLALWALLLLAFGMAVVVLLCRRLMRDTKRIQALQGEIAGAVVQMIAGITKLRAAGAETRAFGKWARRFREQASARYATRIVSNAQTVFTVLYPALCSMVLFAVVIYALEGGLSIGDYLGFNAAFGGLLAAMLALAPAFNSLVTVGFIYERAKPILDTAPEGAGAEAHPARLNGRIELNQIRFRYDKTGPYTIDNVSLRVEPGEFVAIVGASGSGKSTMFRLLLGFEKPDGGSVYFDGQDMDALDVETVRRQMGVVLQNGGLMSGSIFDNIVGSAPLSLDDAWAAAKLAGLDQDIRRMPMQMHTMIMEGAATFSGGQRQRLMIARAVAGAPRILLFDEATSALDNRTQDIVRQSVEDLQATRIVIAHRLSTIINADRIYVMDGGRLVQQGTYDELMAEDGLFQRLAARQIL